MWNKKIKWFAAAAVLSLVAGGVTFYKPLVTGADLTAKANNPPSVVTQVIRDVQSHQREWSEITSGYTPDYTAANILQFGKNRDLYPLLMTDVGNMFDFAARKAQQLDGTSEHPEAFEFVSLNTTYEGPPSEDSAGGGGGGRQYGRGGTGGATAGEEQESKPTIHVTLNVWTTRDTPDSFMRDTLQQWLFDHEERFDEGIPYRIENVSWTKTQEKQVTATGVESRQSGSSSSSRSGAADRERRSPGRIGGGSPFGLGGDRQGSSQGDDEGASSDSSELKNIAPLPPAPLPAPEGKTMYYYSLEWDVVITDESEQDETGGVS